MISGKVFKYVYNVISTWQYLDDSDVYYILHEKLKQEVDLKFAVEKDGKNITARSFIVKVFGGLYGANYDPYEVVENMRDGEHKKIMQDVLAANDELIKNRTSPLGVLWPEVFSTIGQNYKLTYFISDRGKEVPVKELQEVKLELVSKEILYEFNKSIQQKHVEGK